MRSVCLALVRRGGESIWDVHSQLETGLNLPDSSSWDTYVNMVLPILWRRHGRLKGVGQGPSKRLLRCHCSPLPMLLELTAHRKGQPVTRTDTHLNTVQIPHQYSQYLLFSSWWSLQLASEAGEGRYKLRRQCGKWLTTRSGQRSPQLGNTYTGYAGYTGSTYKVYSKTCRRATISSYYICRGFSVVLE